MTTHDARPSAFTNISTTTDWEKWYNNAGIWDGIDGTNSMIPSIDVAGRNAIIGAGNIMIKGQIWWCDGNVPTPIPAASAMDRIDFLVVRYNRSAATSTGVIQPVIITGTPAANPVPPPLQQSTSSTGLWDIPICQWTSHSGGAMDNLIDVRQFSGHSVVAMTSYARPGPTHPRLGLEYDTGYLMRWDGTTWRNIGPKNQVLPGGASATTTSYIQMHTPFPIPANDCAYGPVTYRIDAGGGGKQATTTPRSMLFLIAAFGLSWGASADTGNIPPGATFNWHYMCELLVSPNGGASFYGNFTISQAIQNPGSASSRQAMYTRVNPGGVPVSTATSMVLEGAWDSVTGAPAFTCAGATYERIAN
jgi:hypothetical protein